MVEAARQRLPGLAVVKSDVATWTPDAPVDLLFANAVLQWLPDHGALLPRLFSLLRPGGVLALQMPDNLDEPSHRAMRTVAADGPWADRLALTLRTRESLPPLSAYYDMLAEGSAAVDVWRTTYHHPLRTPAEIADWVRATGLRPFLERLTAAEQPAFLARYEEQIADAYPARADGRRLLAFPRIFVVARRLR